jgi:hypothetical protein
MINRVTGKPSLTATVPQAVSHLGCNCCNDWFHYCKYKLFVCIYIYVYVCASVNSVMYIYIHLHCIYIIIYILYFIERARDNRFCQVSNVASFVDHCLSRSHALRVVWRSRGRRSRHGAIGGHRRSAGWESGVDLGVPGDQMTHVKSDGDLYTSLEVCFGVFWSFCCHGSRKNILLTKILGSISSCQDLILFGGEYNHIFLFNVSISRSIRFSLGWQYQWEVHFFMTREA